MKIDRLVNDRWLALLLNSCRCRVHVTDDVDYWQTISWPRLPIDVDAENHRMLYSGVSVLPRDAIVCSECDVITTWNRHSHNVRVPTRVVRIVRLGIFPDTRKYLQTWRSLCLVTFKVNIKGPLLISEQIFATSHTFESISHNNSPFSFGAFLRHSAWISLSAHVLCPGAMSPPVIGLSSLPTTSNNVVWFYWL